MHYRQGGFCGGHSFLEQANLFIVPLDDDRMWYRYHHLFADYLRSQLDTAAQTGAYLRAAAWYESEGLLEQAVSCALASGDAGAAADYLGRALTRDVTWSSGNMSLLSAWLDALPSGTLEGRPKLCLDASRILYLMGRFDQAEARIRRLKIFWPACRTCQRSKVTAAARYTADRSQQCGAVPIGT